MSTRSFTVRQDDVDLLVTRGGRGRTLLFCPGLNTTVADLRELVDLLERDFDVITYDSRGHGRSSPAQDYSFDAFLGDLGAVLAHPEVPSAPLLAGHSLGADLIVRYTAAHPGAAAGLVVVDGANPLPQQFVAQHDLPFFRAMWETQAAGFESVRGTAHQVLPTVDEVVALNLEVDRVRAGILDAYEQITCPVGLVMSTAMAGPGPDARTTQLNRNWRAGIDALTGDHPDVGLSWVDAGHGLVLTHPADVARAIVRTARDWPDAVHR